MPYNVEINRLPLFALFDLRGDAAKLSKWCGKTLPAFPPTPNSQSNDGHNSLYFVGPDHWLLRAGLEDEQALTAALRPTESPPEISIVNISDTLAMFRITGPDADQVMSIGCPLDLHPSTFGPDAVSYTEFFGLKALVIRHSDGFDCGLDRSYAALVQDYLTQAKA
ncbi:sarcosine oxidase subunit gamma [Aliiroseovarius sp. 2305UL8-7]|uniref:sarcosine oxidase subunit gamma n=1 Tax=Aliiroseovarius conchicola TaxID=3121637 RepID=UPI00352875EF